MRLIDADKLKNELSEWADRNEEKGYYTAYDIIMECIRFADAQPTVYDVDEVAAKIEKKAMKMSTAKPPHTYMKAIGTHEAIAIVRAGGRKEPRNDD